MASLLVLLLPFVCFPFSNAYELPKFIFFLVGAIGLFCVSAYRAYTQEKVLIPTTDKLSILVCVLLFVVFIADILGIDPATSLRGGMFRYQGFVLLFACFCLFISIRLQTIANRQKIFLFFQKGILATLFGICLFTLWQAVSLVFFHNYDIHLYQGRFIGPFGNPDFLGGYLAMGLPFVLFKQSQVYPVIARSPDSTDGRRSNLPSRLPRRRSWKGSFRSLAMTTVRFILIGMILLVIFLSDSRAAFLAVGLVFCIVIARKLRLYKLNVTTWQSSILCFFIASVSIILITNHYDDIYYYSERFLSNRSSIWDNRILIWQGALEAFLRRPILGFGQENFELAFTKVEAYPVDNSHNIFLETLVSSGIAGLFVFLAFLWEVFNPKQEDLASTSQVNGLDLRGLKVRLSLVAFLTVAFFNPLSISEIAFFWFIVSCSPIVQRK